jgi:glucose-1-phosphate cytidylyltransferase
MTDERGPVVVLCGGRGTRLQEHTQSIPKPLVEIGGRPIVWHVVQLYAAQGFERAVLLTGYKGELIEEFAASRPWGDAIEVECVDTGPDTPTGGRVHRARERLDGAPFCLTYGDGVADVRFDELLGFHARHGAAATMTVVRPQLPFGIAELGPDGQVQGFHEKPRSEHWINGGFFRFEPAVFDYLGDTAVLESEPLEGLAADGQLRAFRHTGFWECLDTYKDALALNDLWSSGGAPWKVWD